MKKNIVNIISFILIIVILAISAVGFSFKRSETKSEELTAEELFPDEQKLKGTLFDRSGKTITQTVFNNNYYHYRETNGECFGIIVDGFTADSRGLDTLLAEELHKNNPTVTADGTNAVGQSIELTLDSELQAEVYRLFYDPITKKQVTGCAVISQGSEILAAVSAPSIDLNSYRTDEFERIKYENSIRTHNQVLEGKNSKELIDFIIEARFGTSDYKNIGLNRVKEVLDEEFGWHSEHDIGTLDNSLTYDSESLEVTSVNCSAIWISDLFKECVYGEYIPSRVIKNYVDTNDFSDKIKQGTTPTAAASISDELRQKLVRTLAEFATEHSQLVKKGYTLYGREARCGNVFCIAGIYDKDGNPEHCVTIVLQIEEGIDSEAEAEELFKKITDTAVR